MGGAYGPNTCGYCGEPITAQDRARSRLHRISNLHPECGFRAVVGSLAHCQGRCGCFIPGSTETDPPGLSLRDAARAAYDWAHAPENNDAMLERMRTLANMRVAQRGSLKPFIN